MSGPQNPAGSPLGPFVGPPHVRAAVKATLAAWAPSYVAEAIRQSAVDLPGFIDFVNEPLISPADAGESPRYVVAVPRTLTEPRRKGDGTYIAEWDVQVALWMWGGDYQDTQDRLGYYLIALRQLLIQHPSLGGFAQATRWLGESYAEVATTTFRTWGQAILRVGVSVDGVVSAFAGTAVPPLDPTAAPVPDPAVRSTHITVIPKTD